MTSRAKRGSAAAVPAAEAPEPALDVAQRLEAERARQTAERLEATQAAYDALCAEHAALQDRRRHEEAESYEATAALRRELTSKAAQLAAAQAEVTTSAQQLQEAQAAAAAREAALQTEFASERAAAAQVVAELQARLDALADFQAQRDSMLNEMQRLRTDNAYIAQEAGDKVRALQCRLSELEHAGDVAGLAAGVDGEEAAAGGLCLEADLGRLLVHSRKAAAEMQQYGKEAEELQREMKALEAERAGLLRDVALKEEMEQQYAKRGTLQAREIRTAHTKISSLEKGMVRMAASFEAEKAALEQGLRQQLADATAEQASLRRLLAVRTKELRTVRRLAQAVLLQRSDVEAFLVSSIQAVRAELAASGAGGAPLPPAQASQAALAGGSSSAGGTPSSQPLGSAASWSSRGIDEEVVRNAGGSPAGDAPAGTILTSSSSDGSAVDVRELSWQDRERVLRLLFAKVNRAAAQTVPAVPSVARTQALSEMQAEAPLPPLRGLATEAGPAGLA